MPFCTVAGAGDPEIKLYYGTYGHGPIKVLLIIGLAGTHDSWGPQIKGLTGTLLANDGELGDVDVHLGGEGDAGIEVCAFDNRGMGRSSVPKKRSEYTTKIMAKDAIALLDHLGWKKAHVFGHSMGEFMKIMISFQLLVMSILMSLPLTILVARLNLLVNGNGVFVGTGGMIAGKLAALVPDRVLSLALLNVTGGGFECFPKVSRMFCCQVYVSSFQRLPHAGRR
ncbi:hypothetical protein Droror1_Dr00009433 [Drosera rotundifolia]